MSGSTGANRPRCGFDETNPNRPEAGLARVREDGQAICSLASPLFLGMRFRLTTKGDPPRLCDPGIHRAGWTGVKFGDWTLHVIWLLRHLPPVFEVDMLRDDAERTPLHELAEPVVGDRGSDGILRGLDRRPVEPVGLQPAQGPAPPREPLRSDRPPERADHRAQEVHAARGDPQSPLQGRGDQRDRMEGRRRTGHRPRGAAGPGGQRPEDRPDHRRASRRAAGDPRCPAAPQGGAGVLPARRRRADADQHLRPRRAGRASS